MPRQSTRRRVGIPDRGHAAADDPLRNVQRNLIYTGITRAKKICVLIGATKALAYAIRNMAVLKRNTMLKERIAGDLR